MCAAAAVSSRQGGALIKGSASEAGGARWTVRPLAGMLALVLAALALHYSGRHGRCFQLPAGQPHNPILRTARVTLPESVYEGPACVPARTADYAAALTDGSWQELFEERCKPSPEVAYCDVDAAHQWNWRRQPCHARQLSRRELVSYFAGKTVAAVGDSHGRNLLNELAKTILEDMGVERNPISEGKRHTNRFMYWDSVKRQLVANSSQADSQLLLYWEEQADGITQVVQSMQRAGAIPDVVIFSSGSWYLLADKNGTYPDLQLARRQLARHLAQLRSVMAAAGKAGSQTLWLWLTIPPRVRGKNRKTTWHLRASHIPSINQAARASSIMQPRGPVHLLDLEPIADACKMWCNQDGSHVSETANQLLLRIILNLAAVPPG